MLTEKQLNALKEGRKLGGFKKGDKINLGRKRPDWVKIKISKKLKGRRPWNYIDGRSKLKSPLRYGDDWDKIRYLVYLRDNFTCQDCGVNNKSLDIHHKTPFMQTHDNSLNNLITLCRSCHLKAENKIYLNFKLNRLGGK